MTIVYWGLWLFLTLVLAYIIWGLMFNAFMANMLKNPEGKPLISKRSWHFRLAYPFKKFNRNNHDLSYNFCPYFSKIFFMLILGWPIIVIIEAMKICLYSPFLFLFGRYPVPSLELMEEDQNPFAVEVREFYCPTAANGTSILPINLAILIGCGWLLYSFTSVVLVISLTAASIILLAWIFILIATSKFGSRIRAGIGARIKEWNRSRERHPIRNIALIFKKHNYPLKIKED